MRCIAVLLLALVAPAGHATAGDVTGRVRVTTTLTKKRISLPQVYDRAVSTAAPSQPPAIEAEMRRVIVYVDSEALPSRAIQARMDQKQRRFDPEVIAIPAGSTVTFPNSDPLFHNVFSLSRVRSFDLGNYAGGDTRTVAFPTPGIVPVNCHLHPNMSGAIVVTPNRWFAQPGMDGKFELADLPPGRYRLVAWHKSAGFFRQRIDVGASTVTTVDFEIPVTETAAARP